MESVCAREYVEKEVVVKEAKEVEVVKEEWGGGKKEE